MHILMGHQSYELTQGRKVPVVWDTQRLINGHMLLVGKSGTGKTYSLKRMLEQMMRETKGRMRVHVMDVHGDIDIEGASTVKFSESTPYGFNPLTINPDPDFGGVRKRVQSFIGALNRTGFRLGSRQEAVLRSLLYDLYASHGFYDNDPMSWRIKDGVPRPTPKTHPSIEDALAFARTKLKGMFLGTASKTVGALERLYRKQIQFHSRMKRANQALTPEDEESHKQDMKGLATECVELFQEHLDSLQTGVELTDLLKYDSKDTMKSVVDRLENLNSIGIFRPQRPPFDKNTPVWRYDIKALAQEEKKLFVSFIMEAIFQSSVQRGVQSDLVEIIILDEAHLFLTNDPDNPINAIAKEARKFGLGLFCASQSPTHFSDDFLSNVATKIILGIDQMYWDQTARKLKLDVEALGWIISHQRILMQMNNKGETRPNFMRVAIKE